MELKRDDLVTVLAHPEEEDMDMCYPQYSKFNLGGGVYLEVDGGIVQLIQDPVTMNFPLGRWKMLENNVDEISSVVECIMSNRFGYLSKHLGANVYVKPEAIAGVWTSDATGYHQRQPETPQ